jgi:hypothetical protein
MQKTNSRNFKIQEESTGRNLVDNQSALSIHPTQSSLSRHQDVEIHSNFIQKQFDEEQSPSKKFLPGIGSS